MGFTELLFALPRQEGVSPVLKAWEILVSKRNCMWYFYGYVPLTMPASTQINLIFRVTNLIHSPGNLIKYSCPFLPLCLVSTAELLPFYHSRQDSPVFSLS